MNIFLFHEVDVRSTLGKEESVKGGPSGAKSPSEHELRRGKGVFRCCATEMNEEFVHFFAESIRIEMKLLYSVFEVSIENLNESVRLSGIHWR